MNIALAENIIYIHKRMKYTVNNLKQNIESDALYKEITANIVALKKCVIDFHKTISNIISIEANETEIYNITLKLLENKQSVSELNYLIRIVELYISETEILSKKMENQIRLYKQNWINKVNRDNTTKKKIVVLGINKITIHISKLINQQNAKVIAYCTSDTKYKWNTVNEIPILGTEILADIEYDYLIFGEDSKLVLNNYNSLNLFDYITLFYDFEISRVMDQFLQEKGRINGIITGLSYAETGIDVEKINNYHFLNAALSSQDLYYDFELVKYMLSNLDVSNIKYVIISLGYASFQYDLSLSINKHRTFFYYPFIKNLHHNDNIEVVEKYNNFMKTANVILKSDFHLILYELLKVDKSENWDKMVNGELGKRQIVQTDKMVEKDCKKRYPLTVEENICIIKEYIEFLQSKGIIPIITICPTNERYNQKFKKRISTEFLEIVDKINDKYNLKILDYFNSSLFEDKDFYDVSHLNKRGAAKFTDIINDEIEMLERNEMEKTKI